MRTKPCTNKPSFTVFLSRSYRVILVLFQDLAGTLSNEKGKLVAVQCDLRKEDEIMAMFERLVDELR